MKTPITLNQKFVRNGGTFKVTRRWQRAAFSRYNGQMIAKGRFVYTSHKWYGARKYTMFGDDMGSNKRAAWHTRSRWHETLGDAYRSIMSEARRK